MSHSVETHNASVIETWNCELETLSIFWASLQKDMPSFPHSAITPVSHS